MKQERKREKEGGSILHEANLIKINKKINKHREDFLQHKYILLDIDAIHTFDESKTTNKQNNINKELINQSIN